MASGDDLSGYDSRIRAGLSAFGTDPSYAITIARQAGNLALQQESRASRLVGLTADSDSSDV
jgi:hypothetical protein